LKFDLALRLEIGFDLAVRHRCFVFAVLLGREAKVSTTQDQFLVSDEL